MSCIGCRLAAVLLFVSPSLALPQGRAPVPIEPLLGSNEPRLIALGAWEVIRRQDDSQTDRLIALAEHWDPAQRRRYDDDDGYDAMTVVLDALIQRNIHVSPAAVLAVEDAFPSQALILTERMNKEDAVPILLSLYQAGRSAHRATHDPNDDNRRITARIAAMILARDHPDEIAASILADSLEQLAVSVSDAESSAPDHCLVDCDAPPPCQAETEDEPQTGWPPVFQYTLEENDPVMERKSGFLIYAGGDTITWRRVQAEVHQDFCYSPAPLTPVTRHRLLAEMLHVRDVDIPWGPQMNLTLPWRSDDQFLRDLGSRVRAEEERLQSTGRALYAKGLLTRSQLETSRPRLAVVVFDDRQFDDRQTAVPEKSTLPVLPTHDPRTTCLLARLP